jgi:NDP-sugar pyrophosphorylase family protein
MVGFILAAGEGSRLRPHTEHRPKPMIEVHGHPILEYNVRALAAVGIHRIFINTHYRGEVIKAFFGDGEQFGVRITYLDEPVLLGTAGALGPIRSALDETIVLLYGDNLTDGDLGEIVGEHRRSGAVATLAVFEREDVLASGIVGIDASGRVTRFLEKPAPEQVFSHWVNAGILVAEPAIATFIPASGASDFGREVLPAMLAAGEHLQGYRMHDHLWWIDSLDDYERTLADPALRDFATATFPRDLGERSGGA